MPCNVVRKKRLENKQTKITDLGLPLWLSCNAGDLGSIPGSERSLEEGNGNTLQCSCLENSMDREAWWATVQGSERVGLNLATKPSPPPPPLI